MPPLLAKRRPAEGERACIFCGTIFNVRGVGKHEKMCKKRPKEPEQPTPPIAAGSEKDPELDRNGMFMRTSGSSLQADSNSQIADDQIQAPEIAEDVHVDAEGSGESVEVGGSGKCKLESKMTTDSLPLGLTGLDVGTLNTGDIVIEYHDRSGRAPRILSSEEFKRSLNNDSEPTAPPDDKPWRPFHSREEFEFAELVNDAKLNKTQTERFIKLIRRCQDTPGSFTFNNQNDLKNSLENASKLLTPVIIYLPPV